jgi:hypothetical protein
MRFAFSHILTASHEMMLATFSFLFHTARAADATYASHAAERHAADTPWLADKGEIPATLAEDIYVLRHCALADAVIARTTATTWFAITEQP